MLKVITVPQDSTLYKYSFQIRGKKDIYQGEFIAGCFWAADKMLEDIVYSYNAAEWNKDPGVYGANLVHEVKLWPVVEGKKVTNGKVFSKIDEMDKGYDLYQTMQEENEKRLTNYEKICARITCCLAVFTIALIIIIGVFGESLINLILGYKQ
jgi:hypothetical protein